jgi:putative transcriptional regulator
MKLFFQGWARRLTSRPPERRMNPSPGLSELPATGKIFAMQSANFTNHFLIAMPVLTDPYFAKSLVYICEHNEHGALGIIVNRPLDMTLGNLFERVELKLDQPEISKQPVYFGGPVQTERGFVLHRPAGEWQSNLKVNDEIAMASSRDILLSIADQGTPVDVLVTLGFAGWSAGQLESEILQNAWLSVAAEARVLFELPYEERLPAAMQMLGIDFTSLSHEAGHA